MRFLKTCFILAIALVFLAGCGGQPASSTPAENGTSFASSSLASAKEYSFLYDGTEILLGKTIDTFLSSLGEPMDVFEAPSCAFEGVDKIFYYPGFQINTYPKKEVDYILSITLMDDSVQTVEGIYLGATQADVEAKYGKSTSGKDNVLSYTVGDTELAFIMDNGEVADITYYYIPAAQKV